LRCKQLFTVLAACALPSLAHAFADANQFFADKASPHGATFSAVAEGLYFTGAPRFASQTCANCHVDAPGLIAIKIGADPPSLFTDGYTPGATYQLEVELSNEQFGLEHGGATCTDPPGPRDKYTYVPCNDNGFALEIDDATSTPLAGPGVFCAQAPLGGVCPMPNPNGDESLVAPDGDAVFGARPVDASNPKLELRNGPQRWHLWWTAPKAGSGPVTIFATAVDGNGGDGSAGDDQDPYGDDTVQASVFVQEAGAPAARQASAGCSAAGGGDAGTPSLLLILVGIGGAARLSRRRC
jgi:MYXO-CTERM domain-containing protein